MREIVVYQDRGSAEFVEEIPDAPVRGCLSVGLTDSFIQGDPDRGREIKAPYVRIRHRDRERRSSVVGKHSLRKPSRFRSEHETVSRSELPIGVVPVGLRGEVHKS